MKTFGKSFGVMPAVASLALLALAFGWGTKIAHAASTERLACGSHDAILQALSGKFAEKTASIGLANNGTVVEVLTSADGTWTIVMTAPNGVSCLLAAGDYWQNLPTQAAGRTL